MTRIPALASDDVLVRIGKGAKAHVFRTSAHANMKRFELLDGGTAYDIALCGARGAMVATSEDADLCASCSAALERD